MGRVAEYYAEEQALETTCPSCHGDGEVPVALAPAFNDREGQWYPDEATRECPACLGDGEA